SQAKSASKPHPKDDASLGTPQLNLNKLSDADGLKSGGCPTPAEPILESRSVYTYIGVQVVAETQYGLWRNWPLEKWRELFERLAYVGNHKILLFGFGKEPEITGEHIIDLRGKTTLYELLSIIKNRCRHLVLPDSGILSMVYYLNTSFPIQVVSLWADPNHGILKQNVASPNPQLQHTPLIASERDLNRVSVHAVMECLVPSRPLQHCISYTEIEPQSTLSGVGAILLAGGQGTRAGLKGPKGILSVHGRSLFQWICEKLPEKNFPLAIMTSPLNHEATLSFFKEHHFFGREIFFFPQSLGTILNEKKRPIALGPDGNGSVYKAFVQSGLADQFASRGIELMMIVPIENALADPADATLIAHHRASGAEVTIKCVERKRADEAMGALIEREHRIEILEYLYLKSNETYKYNNTGMMAMDLAFMRKMALVDLPLHWVQKNIQGQSTWKGERFIFDALKYTRKVSAVCYPRELCYAPLKSLDQLSEIEALLERVI
ncbi:MAG: UTP--glucose-1-phosphate uridylyltransferase, partial [Chlamydiia bacterium]|nr:UTP--glucose-1-phosphate uridylyltransferase [Chlamydiia bacterium]